MRRLIETGVLVLFGAMLIVSAQPTSIQAENITPQLRAGASNLPFVDWRTTEVKPQEEVEVVLQLEPELIQEEPQEEVVIEEPTEAEVYDNTFFALVVQAEGYTLGYKGMRYIASAIQNLARDKGCSIDEVLTSGAYTVVNDGSVWRQDLLPETIAAVGDDLKEQIDTEIKYFRTNHYHGFGEPCFNYGNVYFSK